MRLFCSLILSMALLLPVGSAWAAAPPSSARGVRAPGKAATPARGPRVVRRAKATSKAQVFDFEGDVIESEFLRPNSALVETVKKRAGLSLVRIKTSFLDKILSTVDEL